MSNEIVLQNGVPAPSEIVKPALRERFETDWEFGPHSPEVKQALQAVHDRLLPWSRPAPEQVVRAWVAPLIDAIRPDLDPDRLEAWFRALLIAVGHLEVGAFGPQTQREVLTRCHFWPTPAHVYDIVAPAAVRIRRDMAGLRRALAAPTKELVG